MKQTEELERKGYVTGSHAKVYGAPAFASGTIDDKDEDILLNAYGTGTSRGRFNNNTTTSKSSKKSSSKSEKGSKDSKSKSKGKGKDKSDKTSKKIWDKFTKWVSSLFDWAEIRLNKLKEATEKWTTAAQKAVQAGSDAQKQYYKNAINALTKEIDIEKKAETGYKKEAVSIGKKGVKAYNKSLKGKDKKNKIKDADKWVNQVVKDLEKGRFQTNSKGKFTKQGKRDVISKYGEKRADLVKNIQTWYNKSEQSAKAVRDLTDNLQDLYNSLQDIPNVKADKAIEKLANSLKHLQSAASISKYEQQGSYNTSKIQEQTDNLKQQVNNRYAAWNTTNSNLQSSISSIKSIKDWSKKAGIKSGLNNKQKIEIQDTWSTKLKKAVAQYNASLEADTKAQENYLTVRDEYLSAFYENAVKKIEEITTRYESEISKFESYADTINSYIELTKARGTIYDSADNKLLQRQLNDYKESAKKAKEEYQQALNEIVRQLQTGEILKDTVRYNETMTQLANLEKAYYDKEKQVQDFTDTLNNLRFDKLQKALETIKEQLDQLSTKTSYAERIGNRLNPIINYDEDLYQEQIKKNTDLITSAYKIYAENLKEQNKYEINSKPWKEAHEKVTQAAQDVMTFANNILDAAEKIRELRWKTFEDGLHQIERVNEEFSVLLDLLNEDNFLEKNGAFSEEGLTAILLYGKQIDTANAQIKAHQTAIEKLNDEYQAGTITQDELIESTEKHMDAINDLAKSVKDYRENILEQYNASLEKQNDLLQEQIDLRKRNLDKVRETYNYQKTIKESSRDVAYLEQQVRALSGVKFCAYSFNCWDTLRVS